jgi:hypothetical protein
MYCNANQSEGAALQSVTTHSKGEAPQSEAWHSGWYIAMSGSAPRRHSTAPLGQGPARPGRAPLPKRGRTSPRLKGGGTANQSAARAWHDAAWRWLCFSETRLRPASEARARHVLASRRKANGKAARSAARQKQSRAQRHKAQQRRGQAKPYIAPPEEAGAKQSRALPCIVPLPKREHSTTQQREA